MGKNKTQCIVCFLLIATFTFAIQPRLYGQDYLPKEREIEIKMSGKYFWGEGSDFDEKIAKMNAFIELSNQIISDAVEQSEQRDEILNSIEMGAHLQRIPQQGKVKILAWIDKDSVMLTVATKRPITQTPVAQSTPAAPIPTKKEEAFSKQEESPISKTNPVKKDISVLQQLAACKTYEEVKRTAILNGLIRGEIGSGSKGFSNPENCIIAVFTKSGTLSALLYPGGNSRVDLLSGNTVLYPEKYYNIEDYYLWYMQQNNNK